MEFSPIVHPPVISTPETVVALTSVVGISVEFVAGISTSTSVEFMVVTIGVGVVVAISSDSIM